MKTNKKHYTQEYICLLSKTLSKQSRNNIPLTVVNNQPPRLDIYGILSISQEAARAFQGLAVKLLTRRTLGLTCLISLGTLVPNRWKCDQMFHQAHKNYISNFRET